MTPSDFRLWMQSRKISEREAAKQLGCSRTTVSNYANGKTEIPLYIALACAALSFGLPPWRPK